MLATYSALVSWLGDPLFYRRVQVGRNPKIPASLVICGGPIRHSSARAGEASTAIRHRENCSPAGRVATERLALFLSNSARLDTRLLGGRCPQTTNRGSGAERLVDNWSVSTKRFAFLANN
jgi:hypothetical protein